MNLTKSIIALLLASTVLAGCQASHIMHLESIEQGNLFTEEMVAQLKVGMQASEVQAIMGDPILKTPFHSNQWVYVSRVDRRFGQIEQHQVTIIFDDSGEIESIIKS